jgi:hypothetical protein
MKQEIKLDNVIYLCLVGLAGWVVPGGGHLMVGRKDKAAVIFAGVVLAFAIGVYLGSVGVVNPVAEVLWYIPQMMVSPAVKLLGMITVKNGIESFGKPNEIGQIYTSMAGMLNLLCVVNAVYLANLKVSAKAEKE